ncbi:hypothetical protein [Mucilaginibacter sp. UR6-11]|uniref:hypothetical protein n=1 Tax=Mucilaginibacter sp. UR6-11 TaxID=1435644 RepID=UPI001E45AB9A|nr:hypothetical protein [Mucilaginibacter sp. UR6-11]MCC8423669.1 hypothetical protein [Mucilaginibacter sp. UR6-11]
MRLLEQITKHEMMRRWAIGEVHVDLLSSNSAELYKTLKLLLSQKIELEKEGINRALKYRHLCLIDCIAEDAAWYLAALDITQNEFNRLNTLTVPDLAMVTNNTYKINYGAHIIRQNPDLNPRISNIMNALRKKHRTVQLTGITLLAKNATGPFTIVEGNGRLISLYNILFNEGIALKFAKNDLQVVLAISNEGI